MGIQVAAKVSKLSQEEIEEIQSTKIRRTGGKRAAVLEEYKSAFDGEDALTVGDWAVIEAADRAESLKNKRYALKAAESFGLALEFYRFDPVKMRVPFKVITLDELNAKKAAKPPRKPRKPRVVNENDSPAPAATSARVRVRT